MADDDGASRLSVDVLRVKPTIGSTLLVIAAIGTAVVVGNVFVAARRTLAWVFATVVVAWLLSAVIDLLSRWMPRGLALLLTILTLVVVVAGTWVGVTASLRSEVRHIQTSLPAAARNLEQRYDAAAKFGLEKRVQSFVDDLNKRFSTRAAVSKAAGTAPVYFVSGVLMLFFLGYGPRYVTGALKQIRDPDRRATVVAVVGRASGRARGYLLVTMAQVVAVVALSTLVFWILDLPAPFVLGLLIGALGAIPNLGVILGGIPALLVAAADPDEVVILTVLALVAALQLAEALALRPWVDRRTVRVGPALMLIVAILGFQMYGYGGAIYASAGLVFVVAVFEAWAAQNERATA